MYRCSPVAHRICSSLSPRIREATAVVAPVSIAATRTRSVRLVRRAQKHGSVSYEGFSPAVSDDRASQDHPRSKHVQLVSDNDASQDHPSTRHVRLDSEATRRGRRTYHRPSSITSKRLRKQKLDRYRKKGTKDELPGNATGEVPVPGDTTPQGPAQLVTNAIRLDGALRRQISPLRRQRLPISRNEYWLGNYQLLRYIDAEDQHVGSLLGFHRQRANRFARGGSWRLSRRWIRANIRDPNLGLSILIGSLADSAAKALALLCSIPNRPSTYFMHADALFFLRRSRWEEIQANSKLTTAFWDQVQRSRDVSRWPKEPIRAWHLDLLLQNIQEEEQRPIISAYLDKYDQLDDLRLLYIVDRYTRFKDVEAALSVLRRVSPTTLHRKGEIQEKSWAVAPRCMNLLELETVQRDGESHSFKVLPAMLELGVPPDDLIYDIVTQNSVKFELPAVAWDIFRYARAQGAVIGPQTHLMLLKDSYLRRNATTLNEMLSIIQQSPELYQHPPINAYMVNIIRGICTYERGSGPAEALARMLAVYDKAYTRAPLAKVGIIPPLQAEQGNPDLPEPESLPLAFMIFSYIMVQKDQVVVTRFWERLVSKMNQGDRGLLAAARHPVFYDGFVCFYSKNESSISRALGILRYMLASETCLPGDITWSMVIGMFLRHGKEESAEKVRQLMLQRGVPVTAKAWQHVLLSYPYTEIAQEVRKILGLGPESDVQDGRHVGDDVGTQVSESTESSVDVTKSQVDRSYGPDDNLGTVWTAPKGLNSVFHAPVEKKVHV